MLEKGSAEGWRHRLVPAVKGTPVSSSYFSQTPPKSFVVTWLLSLFLGSLGVDRFYLGKIGTGLLKLITIGGFGLWSLIDLILVLTNNQRGADGRLLQGYEENKTMAIIVSIVVWVFGLGITGFSAVGGN